MSNTNNLVAVDFSSIQSTQQSINDIQDQFGDKAQIVFRQDKKGNLYATKLKWGRILHFDYANDKVAKRFESMFGSGAKDVTELMHRRWFGCGPLSRVKKAVSKDVLTQKLQKLVNIHLDNENGTITPQSSFRQDTSLSQLQDDEIFGNGLENSRITYEDEEEDSYYQYTTNYGHLVPPSRKSTLDDDANIDETEQSEDESTLYDSTEARTQYLASLKMILTFEGGLDDTYNHIFSEANKSYNTLSDYIVTRWPNKPSQLQSHRFGKAEARVQEDHNIWLANIMNHELNSDCTIHKSVGSSAFVRDLSNSNSTLLKTRLEAIKTASALKFYLQSIGRDRDAMRCDGLSLTLSEFLKSQQTDALGQVLIPELSNFISDANIDGMQRGKTLGRTVRDNPSKRPGSLEDLAQELKLSVASVKALAATCQSDFGTAQATSLPSLKQSDTSLAEATEAKL
ncbi:hypothetical protein AB1K70_03370 [Bremerella sp. JC770]|uniref:hypothetical protein n=1 Tax=Bremerella sp. JC770 TaxID=3232137 RepID=UPI0034584560